MPFLVSTTAAQLRLAEEVSFPEGVVTKLIKQREALRYLQNKLESIPSTDKNKKEQ